MTVGITIEREIKSYNLSSQEANIWNCLKNFVSPSIDKSLFVESILMTLQTDESKQAQ